MNVFLCVDEWKFPPGTQNVEQDAPQIPYFYPLWMLVDASAHIHSIYNETRQQKESSSAIGTRDLPISRKTRCQFLEHFMSWFTYIPDVCFNLFFKHGCSPSVLTKLCLLYVFIRQKNALLAPEDSWGGDGVASDLRGSPAIQKSTMKESKKK